MRLVKRLYLFVLKSFLPLFAMTFLIVLFIVLMQFLWKYINDLVGKGLSVDVLGELFFYAAVSMVPMALPLAILLASLMTFGNFGEKFELTAMKASGISLVQVMKPLIVLVTFVAVGAFFFQNDVLPKAQVKMWTLLFSARQKSPELEIPEGVFYDQIPGYNIYVEKKNRDTGMLYGTMIYANGQSISGSTILIADSALLATTPDMKYLYLHMFHGEQFENLREQTGSDRNMPYRRESFFDKEILIPFDANFTRMDEGGMRKQYVGKNIDELHQTIDSIGLRVDSMAGRYTRDLRQRAFPLLPVPGAPAPSYNFNAGASSGYNTDYFADSYTSSSASADSLTDVSIRERDKMKIAVAPVDIDSLVTTLSPSLRSQIYASARNIAIGHKGSLEFRAAEMASEKKSIRRHQIEQLKKFTLSVACLIFFFIGAPLGAIIRKGGLGTPLVISVLLFLFYYIIDNTGYKMARDGHTAVWLGMWLSTFILAPLSVYVTYKAMTDSAVFDKDRYVLFFRKIFGMRSPRTVAYKEVVIEEMDPAQALIRLDALYSELLKAIPQPLGFKDYFLKGYDRKEIDRAGEMINDTITYMSDTHDLKLIDRMSLYPEVFSRWICRPACGRRWLGIALMAIPGVDLILWLISRHYRKTIASDILASMRATRSLIDYLDPASAPFSPYLPVKL